MYCLCKTGFLEFTALSTNSPIKSPTVVSLQWLQWELGSLCVFVVNSSAHNIQIPALLPWQWWHTPIPPMCTRYLVSFPGLPITLLILGKIKHIHTHSPVATCNKTANLRWGQTISYAKCESSLPACSTIPFCVSAEEQVDTQWLLTVWWTRTQLLVPKSEPLFHLTMVNLFLSYCCKHVWLA